MILCGKLSIIEIENEKFNIYKKEKLLFKIETKKIHALKVAPWWKRLLSYTIDSTLLLTVLTAFFIGIYKVELQSIADSATQYGGLQLGIKEDIFSKEALSQLSSQSVFEQNATYVAQIIKNKYFNTIFLLNQILSVLYYVMFWWSTGQTIGAKLLKIKVTTIFNERPSVFSIFSRVIALKLIEMGGGIPALIVINPILKQRFHDSLSQTVVIEEFSEEEEEEIIDNLTNDDESTLYSDEKSIDDKDL